MLKFNSFNKFKNVAYSTFETILSIVLFTFSIFKFNYYSI